MFPFKDANKVPLQNPLEVALNRSSEKQKEYGPRATFQKGVLGNYEPDYKLAHGPGKRSWLPVVCFHT